METRAGPEPAILPACPLCEARDSVERFSERGYRVRRCQRCGLFFIDPYGVATGVHKAVRTYDYGHEIDIIDADRKYLAESKTYEAHLPMLLRDTVGATSLLDVGCGMGRLLELMRERRPDLHRVGIELNAERATRARAAARCEIHEVPIEQFESDRKFDVVTLMDVLSHVPSFDGMFEAIRAVLAPNGKLIMRTGEVQHDARKRDLHDWGIPDHLHFLGLETLSELTRKYGARVLRHDRIAFSDEAFSEAHFRVMGRSPVRNAVKRLSLAVPGARQALKVVYDVARGRRIFSSYIVLTWP